MTTATTTLLPIGLEDTVKRSVSQEVVEQSSIPLEIRRSLSQQISKPRNRSQLKSSLFLPR